MPTGSGKTIVAKEIIDGAVRKGGRVLFLAPRRELIYQTAEKLTQAGISYGIMMAGETPKAWHGVQVACIPTFHRRCIQSQRASLPDAAVVLVDEAHLAVAQTTQEILAKYPDAVKIGLTATPCRGDGKGLGEVFDSIVLGPSVAELMADGFLVNARYFAPSSLDLTGVKITAGDYNEGQLGTRMDQPMLVGDIVTNWSRIAPDRVTVVFAVNVAHALHIRDEFEKAGVPTAHIDGETPNEDRKAILRGVSEGRIQVLTSVDVCTYGWDSPRVSCAILARPTKSITRYLQSVGRVLRPFPGKADCIVIDHAGNVDEHGFADELREWSLAGAVKKDRERSSGEKAKERSEVTCGTCKFVFRAQSHCPNCGAEVLKRKAAEIETVDDDLQELDRKKKRLNKELTHEQKGVFFAELKGYAIDHNLKDGWAAHKYRERFGVWPNAHRGMNARKPTSETISFIKHLAIKWRKQQEKQRAAA